MGRIDTWDYQWLFALWAQNALAISPSTNLVSNIGVGEDSTHTKTTSRGLSISATAEMVFPLRHPPYMAPHIEAERYVFGLVKPKPQPSLYWQLLRKLSTAIPSPLRVAISNLMSRWA